MNGINNPVLTAVLTVALCSIAASSFTGSPAQDGQNQGNRKTACGCYVCDKLLIVEFGIAPGDCYGILAQDACQVNLSGNSSSPELRRSYCNSVKSKIGEVCPQSAGICDSPNGDYCGETMPDKGSVFAAGSTLPIGRVYSGTSTDSTVTGTYPNGTRMVYTQTSSVDGQRWYYVQPPGRPAGWMPGSEVSCTRPGEQNRGVGSPPVLNPDGSTPRPTAAIVAGARG